LLFDTQIIIFEQDHNKSQRSKFNKSVNSLPNEITHLTFGNYFDRSVNSLPANITYINCGYYFNQSVNSPPKNLTHINFGCRFNQLVNSLPSTLIEICFYSHYTIKNNIPNSIEFLNIIFCEEDMFNEPIENPPANLKEIRINEPDKVDYLKKIPFGCKVVDKSSGEEIFL
jgi:hypothetical protein